VWSASRLGRLIPGESARGFRWIRKSGVPQSQFGRSGEGKRQAVNRPFYP
jgi:hypothetical protein